MELLFWIALLLLIGWVYQQAIESRATRREGRRQRWFDAEAMPAELRSATLYASEQRLACRWPVALVGRSDQVYRLADGSLLLVETKTRGTVRVYEADVVQLSVYRVLLTGTDDPRFAGWNVCPRAYVRIRTPRRGGVPEGDAVRGRPGGGALRALPGAARGEGAGAVFGGGRAVSPVRASGAL